MGKVLVIGNAGGTIGGNLLVADGGIEIESGTAVLELFSASKSSFIKLIWLEKSKNHCSD